MKTLGLLIVIGALGYAYVMQNPDVLDLYLPKKVPARPSAPKEASAQSVQQEAEEHREEEQSGDHLFPADLTG